MPYFPLMIALMTLLLAAPGSQHARPMKREVQQFEEILHQRYGTIVIAGTITDEEGNPLDKVMCSLAASAWKKDEGRHETRLFDGKFEVKYDDTDGVSLHFMKRGYHDAHFDVSFHDPVPSAHIEGRKHTYDNVKIVLTKAKHLTKLNYSQVRLTIEPDGTRTVWDLSDATFPYPERPKGVQFGPDETINPPAVYLRLTPSEKPKPAEKNKRGYIATPENAYLEVVIDDGQDGGFVPAPVPHYFVRAYASQEYLQAPSEGYETVFRIPAEYLTGQLRGSPWFYVRLNGLYGKGYIGTARYGEAYARVSVTFRIQPDGSRNVETID